jgi:hypothetical protein
VLWTGLLQYFAYAESLKLPSHRIILKTPTDRNSVAFPLFLATLLHKERSKPMCFNFSTSAQISTKLDVNVIPLDLSQLRQLNDILNTFALN